MNGNNLWSSFGHYLVQATEAGQFLSNVSEPSQ